MMLPLLIYCYATGRFSSREIAMATHSDVAGRYICGGEQHPDHDTICTFRRTNRALFEECFVNVLAYAGQPQVLKKVGGISIDGTKIAANASKHAAVSYDHAMRASAPVEERMRYRLRTQAGRVLYVLRKATVAPGFGSIKAVMGFRRFMLRGKANVALEWSLVTLAYNFRRLYRLLKGEDGLRVGWTQAYAG